MTEIVRRGVRLVPALLDHLSDRRPTRLNIDPQALRLDSTSGPFTDAYDSRFREGHLAPAGVNSWGTNAPRGNWPYVAKVGDLCFVALGQIVNRRLYLAGPDFHNGLRHSGGLVLEINSPVECPALAEAARADWGGISSDDFAAQLEHDSRVEDRHSSAGSRTPADWIPKIDRAGALTRLLFYYPGEGSRVAESLLRRSLVDSDGELIHDERPAIDATDNDQAELLNSLDRFHWDSKDRALWDLFRAAAGEERRRVAAHPDAAAYLANDLPRVCAERLIHTGHDNEIGVFFSEEVARMIREYPAEMARRKAEIMAGPSVYNAAPGSRLADAESRRQQLLIDGARTFLRRSIESRIELLGRIGISGFAIPAD